MTFSWILVIIAVLLLVSNIVMHITSDDIDYDITATIIIYNTLIGWACLVTAFLL